MTKKNETKQSVSRILRKQASKLGFTLMDIAKITGLSYESIKSIAAGRVPLSVKSALLIGEAIDYDASELMELSVEQRLLHHRSKMKLELETVSNSRQELSSQKKHAVPSIFEGFSDRNVARRSYIFDARNKKFKEQREAFDKHWIDYTGSSSAMRRSAFKTSVFTVSRSFKSMAEMVVAEAGESKWVPKVILDLYVHGVFVTVGRETTQPSCHSSSFYSQNKATIAYTKVRGFGSDFLFALLHQLGHLHMHVGEVVSNPEVSCNWIGCRRPNESVFMHHDLLAQESEAHGFVMEVISAQQIEDAYKRMPGKDINDLTASLPDIPPIFIFGYLRWYKPHYRDRILGSEKRFSELYDEKFIRDQIRKLTKELKA